MARPLRVEGAVYHITSRGNAREPIFLSDDDRRWFFNSRFDPVRARAIYADLRFVRQGRGISAWSDLQAGSLLGSDAFVEQMMPLLLEVPVDPEILRCECGRDCVAAGPSLEELFLSVSDKTTRDEWIYQAVRCYHYKL